MCRNFKIQLKHKGNVNIHEVLMSCNVSKVIGQKHPLIRWKRVITSVTCKTDSLCFASVISVGNEKMDK